MVNDVLPKGDGGPPAALRVSRVRAGRRGRGRARDGMPAACGADGARARRRSAARALGIPRRLRGGRRRRRRPRLGRPLPVATRPPTRSGSGGRSSAIRPAHRSRASPGRRGPSTSSWRSRWTAPPPIAPGFAAASWARASRASRFATTASSARSSRPPTGTARPGVLAVGGSDGGLSEGMAALLASHGFVGARPRVLPRRAPATRSDGDPARVLRDSHPLARTPDERGGGRPRRGRPIPRRRAGPAAGRHVSRDHGGGRLRSERCRPRGHRRLARRGGPHRARPGRTAGSRCPSCRLPSTGARPGPRRRCPRLRSS